ncbi:MAG: Aminotransferase class [Cytophagaceae bacterium]|jgi:branched-chain amino acid aminotransferase/4-amino-4-deoxychorismate lyase|nr:Aminotransferase class [Cytophagaceae bacterium]
MAVLFNDRITPESSMDGLLRNRGFLYGDGFFETIVLRDGRIFFLEAHLERALKAMQVLQLHTDKAWTNLRLLHLLQQLWRENGSPKDAVFKWIVWRDSEGLYSPVDGKDSHYLIELKPYRSAPAVKPLAYLANTVTNVASAYSSFKRLSSLHYVMAGLEKTNRKADELILTDQTGNLSEATSSCLFWIQNDALYTPALSTGCIEGVVRQSILKWAAHYENSIEETTVPLSYISPEATVFTANVAGLSLIAKLEDKVFLNDDSWYTDLQHDLFDSTAFSQNL